MVFFIEKQTSNVLSWYVVYVLCRVLLCVLTECFVCACKGEALANLLRVLVLVVLVIS